MGKLLEELKRRKVFRVAAAYAVVAWVLIQVSSTILPTFSAPEWVNQTITLLFILGFPVSIILAWAYEVTPDGEKPDTTTTLSSGSQTTSPQPINYLILAIVLLVAGFQITDRFLIQSGGPSQLAGEEFTTDSIVEKLNLNLGDVGYTEAFPMPLGISRDGQKIVYASRGSLRLRDISEPTSTLLIDSDGLQNPVFSPDGQQVLFERTLQGLEVLSLQGGSPRRLTVNLDTSTGFDWIDNNRVIYIGRDRAIYTLSLDNPEPELLVDAGTNVIANVQALPGANAILYVIKDEEAPRVVIHDTETGESTTLINNAYKPRYLPTGHIVFAREQELWGVNFDIDQLRTIGELVPLVQDIQGFVGWNSMSYDVSETGRLIYRPAVDRGPQPTIPTWVYSDGSEESIPLTPGYYFGPRLAPDESRLAILKDSPGVGSDVWVYDFQTRVSTRLTFNRDAVDIIWSPDGQYLYYGRVPRQSADGNTAGIWRINSDGSGQPEQMLSSTLRVGPKSITSDGRQIIYIEGDAQNWETRILSLGVENTTQLLLPHVDSEYEAILSPDQNWTAYTGREFGPHAIFVRRFAAPQDGKWLVTERARQPVFSAASDKLYFVDFFDTDNLLSVNIVSAAPFAVDEPVIVAEAIFGETFSPPSYDVTNNGDRLLVLREDLTSDYEAGDPQAYLEVVNNWFKELEQLVPTPE